MPGGRATYDVAAIARVAEHAAASDSEEQALPTVRAAARATSDHRLWHWTGLLERSIDRRDRALPAFEQASRLRPDRAVTAHALARTRLEAGLPAVDAFTAARRLAPLDGDILLGTAAALLAAGERDAAVELLAAQLGEHPGWYAGHAELARLQWAGGDRSAFCASYEAALAVAPRDPNLWLGVIDASMQARDWDACSALIAQATDELGPVASLALRSATLLSESGKLRQADSAFEDIGLGNDPAIELRRIRQHLRQGHLDRARERVEHMLAAGEMSAIWPYAAITWRLLSDQRWDWLAAANIVQFHDLGPTLPPLDRLAGLLDRWHRASGEQLDQSVRGGTQTAGSILSRIEHDVMAVRSAIAAAVSRYVAALPARDPRHPTLRARRDRGVRLAGSWSVRLRPGGHHANHVHPQGWISSALYVELPAGQANGGKLSLGAPDAGLGLDLHADRIVDPKPGRLVLFPSWMWHGTTPFSAGRRTSIAFDVAMPRE